MIRWEYWLAEISTAAMTNGDLHWWNDFWMRIYSWSVQRWHRKYPEEFTDER